MIILLSVITDSERKKLSEMIIFVAKGDENALTLIYKLAGGRLFSVAMGIMRDYQLAEDVLHDSFIKIANCAYQFKAGTNGYAWLCRIIRNTAINKIKNENIRRGLDIDSFFNIADGKNFEDRSESVIQVENAMKALSSKERTVIWLKYYNDMTIREISSEISIPKSTVHEIIKQAETKLKKLLYPSDEKDN